MPWSYKSRMTRLKPARLQLEVTIAKSWSMIQCMYTLWQRVEPPPDKIPCQPIKLSAESPRVEPAHTCQGNFVAQSWCQNRACACCKHGPDVLRLITLYTSRLPWKLCGTGLFLQKWFPRIENAIDNFDYFNQSVLFINCSHRILGGHRSQLDAAPHSCRDLKMERNCLRDKIMMAIIFDTLRVVGYEPDVI